MRCLPLAGPTIRAVLVIAAWIPAAAWSQTTQAGTPGAVAAPYIARGRDVEARQRILTERVTHFHAALADTLRRWAPDMLPRLEPPPPIATGYQLLPKIVPGAPPQPVVNATPLVSYGWRWSSTLMDREIAALAQLETALAGSSGRRTALDSLVTSYRALADRKKLVDADVNYNWLWQAEVTRLRAVFDRSTALQDAILRQRGSPTPAQRAEDSALIARGLAADIQRVDAPPFVRFEQRGREWIVTVPIVTDITDTAFVNEFARVVSESWRAAGDGVDYRVVAAIRMISPTALYCPAVALPPCAPPERGSAINLSSHIARFPAGEAVLTTGAGSTHFQGGRAVVLSPHDAPRYLIAHEFGHLLGFRDAYLRGYRDAGFDGLIITELVVDNGDVMGNSRDGAVRAAHFEQLLLMKDVPALMQAGLAAFYERGDARQAVARFQQVLARQPFHYGAGFQLAKALDALGQPAEAATQWRKVLDAALLIGDTATMRQVRERLSPRP